VTSFWTKADLRVEVFTTKYPKTNASFTLVQTTQ